MLAYSPLAFGVLGCAPGAEETLPATWLRRRLFRRLLPASLELRSEMQAIAIERGASMVQVALNWCRALGTTPIPGLRTPDQARDVAGAPGRCRCRNTNGWMARRRCSERMPANPFRVANRSAQASEADSGAGLTTTGRLSPSLRIGMTLSWERSGRGQGACPVVGRMKELLQQNQSCPGQSMPGDLQEGARQGFAGGAPQGRVVLPVLLLVLNGTDNRRVTSRLVDALCALLWTATELLLHVLNSLLEAFQNLALPCRCEPVPIRKVGQVGHEHLAVIAQGEEGWSYTLPVTLLPVLP